MLLGRVDPPLNAGVATLMEVAEVYYARASEIMAGIQRAEQDGVVPKGDPYNRFRTGELRTFMEATKRTIDMGSRRITLEMEANRASGYIPMARGAKK